MDESSIDWFVPVHLFLEDIVVVGANPEEGFTHEYVDIADAQQFWDKLLVSIEIDPMWSEGKHCGDCTKEPMTCMRCYVDSTRREAMHVFEFMRKLVNIGYPGEVYK